MVCNPYGYFGQCCVPPPEPSSALARVLCKSSEPTYTDWDILGGPDQRSTNWSDTTNAVWTACPGCDCAATTSNKTNTKSVYTAANRLLNSPTSQSDTQTPGAFGNVDRGGTADWSNVSNAGASDDTYATSSPSAGQTCDFLRGVQCGFAIDSTNNILGVEVDVERKSSGASQIDDSMRLQVDGSWEGDDKAGVINWTNSDLVFTYGGSSDLWNTTTSLTPAIVNQANFGAGLSPRNDGGGAATLSIDHMQITVYHEGDEPWQNLALITASDNLYATSTNLMNSGEKTNYALCRFILKPVGVHFDDYCRYNITGIEVTIERKCIAGNVKDHEVKIVLADVVGGTSDTNKASASAWPTSDGTATYGGSTDLWGETSISAAEVFDQNGFGVAISATATGSSERPSIDHVTCKVYYTEESVSCWEMRSLSAAPVPDRGDSGLEAPILSTTSESESETVRNHHHAYTYTVVAQKTGTFVGDIFPIDWRGQVHYGLQAKAEWANGIWMIWWPVSEGQSLSSEYGISTITVKYKFSHALDNNGALSTASALNEYVNEDYRSAYCTTELLNDPPSPPARVTNYTTFSNGNLERWYGKAECHWDIWQDIIDSVGTSEGTFSPNVNNTQSSFDSTAACTLVAGTGDDIIWYAIAPAAMCPASDPFPSSPTYPSITLDPTPCDPQYGMVHHWSLINDISNYAACVVECVQVKNSGGTVLESYEIGGDGC